jgi:predicted DsbA family dithiol-disulfide isomerase
LEPDYDCTKIYIETNRQRLIQKWGGIRQWEIQKQRHQLKERGLEVGISHFNLDRYASNTINSHRIIQYMSRTYGLYISEYVYDTLNQYHFVDGYALNDIPRLAKTIAQSLQELYTKQPLAFTKTMMMDHSRSTPSKRKNQPNHKKNKKSNGNTTTTAAADEPTKPSSSVQVLEPPTESFLMDFLYGTDGRDEILQTVEMVHDFGINGIPTFILEAGETIWSGAIHANEMVQYFRTIEQRGYLIHNAPIFTPLLDIPTEIIQRGSYHRRHSNVS